MIFRQFTKDTKWCKLPGVSTYIQAFRSMLEDCHWLGQSWIKEYTKTVIYGLLWPANTRITIYEIKKAHKIRWNVNNETKDHVSDRDTKIYEPRHDKTNAMSVRPVKTQISLGIRPVWSEFAVRTKKPWVLGYPLSAQRRLWSDWAESSLGAHSFCWFCHVVAHI